MLRKIRWKISSETALKIYNTTVESHLLYCISVWGNACTTFTKPLLSLQKRCLRSCFCCNTSVKAPELFSRANKLPFSSIFTLRLATIVYKFYNCPNLLPTNIFNLFQPITNVHNHRTRQLDNLDLFSLPCTNNIRKATIRFSAPVLWRQIPINIKSASSLKLFKTACKKFLIDNI